MTLSVPNLRTGSDHSHVDVASPMEASQVIQSVSRSTGTVPESRIESYSEHWECGECSGWRIEMKNLVLP